MEFGNSAATSSGPSGQQAPSRPGRVREDVGGSLGVFLPQSILINYVVEYIPLMESAQ